MSETSGHDPTQNPLDYSVVLTYSLTSLKWQVSTFLNLTLLLQLHLSLPLLSVGFRSTMPPFMTLITLLHLSVNLYDFRTAHAFRRKGYRSPEHSIQHGSKLLYNASQSLSYPEMDEKPSAGTCYPRAH